MSEHSLKSFDPYRVAELDARMWQAYYAHKFFLVMQLAVVLFKEQFKVNTITALRLGYHTMRAAMEFRKTGNVERAEHYVRIYYTLLNRHALEDFDPTLAAQTELEWWVIHRYPSRGSLAQALADNMAVLYSVPPKKLMSYAKERAKAMELRDHATHKERREPDWQAITQHLEKSYRALLQAVQK